MDLRWQYTETPMHLIKICFKELQALLCILLVGEQLFSNTVFHILALGVEVHCYEYQYWYRS